jgi:hypothetical protein
MCAHHKQASHSKLYQLIRQDLPLPVMLKDNLLPSSTTYPHHHVHVHVTIENKINKFKQISNFIILFFYYARNGDLFLLFFKHKGTISCILGDFLNFKFYFSILWGRWTGDHPKEDLAKFGWRSKRNVFFFSFFFLFSNGAI